MGTQKEAAGSAVSQIAERVAYRLPLREDRLKILLPAIGARLAYVLELREVKGRELARMANVPESQVGHIINARSAPAWDIIVSLAKAAGVDERWLLTGDGEAPQAQRPAAASHTSSDHIVSPESAEGVETTQSARDAIAQKREGKQKVLTKLERSGHDSTPSEGGPVGRGGSGYAVRVRTTGSRERRSTSR